MHAARLRELGRRPRRGSLERPVNGRLVRVSATILVLPLLIAALTVSRAGPLPVPTLPPSFDGDAAYALTKELVRRYPLRIPGSAADQGAAQWLRDTLAQYGLNTEADTWRESVPGLGRVQLTNLAVVVKGAASGVILVVAHRDTGATGPGANDDATGTAALIQLARAYATIGSTGRRPTPSHTLVFLSTDAGAWGGLGTRRFARSSPLRGDVLAAVVLDGLGGNRRVRLDLAGDRGRSPSPTLVRTAIARVREQVSDEPGLPGILSQLVDLSVPFAYGEQAPLLGRGTSAVRLTTGEDSGAADATDTLGGVDAARLDRVGGAAQNLLGSLDAVGELAQGSSANLFLHGRVIRGWALGLLLIAALVPFCVGVLDLLARSRRQHAPLAPAFRALRRRIGFWGTLAAAAGIGAAIGFFPSGPPRPLAPHGPEATDWPVTGLVLLAGAGLAAWFVARRRLVPQREVTRPEELAGYCAALTGLGVLAALVAIVHPLALVLLLPSLYCWLWLPQAARGWTRDVLFGLGLAGALLVLVSLGERFRLGARTPLYVLDLVTSGYIAWTSVVFVVVWAGIAGQFAALVAGRYSPYADGAARPPRGPLRETVRRTVLAAQSRRR